MCRSLCDVLCSPSAVFNKLPLIWLSVDSASHCKLYFHLWSALEHVTKVFWHWSHILMRHQVLKCAVLLIGWTCYINCISKLTCWYNNWNQEIYTYSGSPTSPPTFTVTYKYKSGVVSPSFGCLHIATITTVYVCTKKTKLYHWPRPIRAESSMTLRVYSSRSSGSEPAVASSAAVCQLAAGLSLQSTCFWTSLSPCWTETKHLNTAVTHHGLPRYCISGIQFRFSSVQFLVQFKKIQMNAQSPVFSFGSRD